MTATRPDITAIVCTRNRARLLDSCLASLLHQTLPKARYEILVIDNGSTDDTAAVCRRYEPDGVRRVSEPVPGLSRARNTGWKAAQAPYVGYIDDDATACEDWLGAALEGFMRQPAPDWVGGPIYLQWETNEPDWMNDELRGPLGYVYWGDSPRQLSPAEWLGGGNSFYSRAKLAELGGFDERLGRKDECLLSGEEIQLQKRIEHAGGFLFYAPSAAIRHNVPADRVRPSWFYKRYYWGGVSDVILRRTAPSGHTVVASRAVAGPQGGSRLYRLISNAMAAGLATRRARRIQARIYMSYVLGSLRGSLSPL